MELPVGVYGGKVWLVKDVVVGDGVDEVGV